MRDDEERFHEVREHNVREHIMRYGKWGITSERTTIERKARLKVRVCGEQVRAEQM
jgi:hypothetical protein